jgi:hypothetical protein
MICSRGGSWREAPLTRALASASGMILACTIRILRAARLILCIIFRFDGGIARILVSVLGSCRKRSSVIFGLVRKSNRRCPPR